MFLKGDNNFCLDVKQWKTVKISEDVNNYEKLLTIVEMIKKRWQTENNCEQNTYFIMTLY